MALAIDGGNSNAAFASSTSAAMTTTVSNDVIIAFVMSEQSGSNPTVSDNSGVNTGWALRNKEIDTIGGTWTTYEYWTTWTAAATATVSVAGANSFAGLICFGIRGANTSSPFDADAPWQGDQVTSLTVGTASANTVIFGIYAASSSGNAGAATGWNNTPSNLSGDFFSTQYNIYSAAQTGLSFPINSGISGPITMMADAIVQASSGGVSVPVGVLGMAASEWFARRPGERINDKPWRGRHLIGWRRERSLLVRDRRLLIPRRAA
jgi:hypothetical protein